MPARQPHNCSGIDCELCIAVEVIEAGHRELLHKATPRHSGSKRSRMKKDSRTTSQKANEFFLGGKQPDHYCIGTGCVFCLTKRSSVTPEPTPQQQPLVADGEPFVPAPAALTTAEQALTFITAGNAYFTLRSKKTGARYTYRINVADCMKCQQPSNKHTPRCFDRADAPSYFVALLTGPDNEGDYTYLGMLRNNVFRLTRNSKMKLDAPPVAAIEWTIRNLFKGEMHPALEIWHEGKCGRCGRKLTVPESIASGIGPVCEGKE